MDKYQVLEALQEIIRLELEDPALELREAMPFGDHPRWDSLAHFRIIVAVETRFGIALDLDEHADMMVVGDIIEPILRRISARDHSLPRVAAEASSDPN